MSDLRSVQFDVCDGHGEVVSIASDTYVNNCSILRMNNEAFQQIPHDLVLNQ